jgi:transcription elongation factor Elf1
MEKNIQEFMTCPKCDHTDRNLKLLPDEEGYYSHTCSECGYFYKVTFDLTTFINYLMANR